MCTDQYTRKILECKATVHARYTISIHQVHLLCTGRGRISTRGQSWNIRKLYTFSTRSVYTQYTTCVQSSRRAVDGPVHAVNPEKQGNRTRSVHVQYTSGTPLVYRPWAGSRRVGKQGFLCCGSVISLHIMSSEDRDFFGCLPPKMILLRVKGCG